MAAEWLSCEDERQKQNFRNNWCGEKYTIRTKVPKWRELGKRLEAGHSRGTVPASAFFLTAGVDVQADRAYWVVRAWGEDATSWLVDWGVAARQLGEKGESSRNSDLAQIKSLVIERYFPWVGPNPVGTRGATPLLTGLDCGFEPHRVWGFVRQFPPDRVRAVAGDEGMGAEFYQMTTVERSARDGKAYDGALQRWGIRVSTYKADIQDRWGYGADQPGAWLLPYRILEVGESYLMQVTNEAPVNGLNKKGRPVTAWNVLEPRLGNHWWDAEVYARALADMVTGGQWTDLQKVFSPRAVRRDEHAFHDDEFSAR
jgi:phage terminase large subunit GpA-like protein